MSEYRNYTDGRIRREGSAFTETANRDRLGPLAAVFSVLTESQRERVLHAIGWGKLGGEPAPATRPCGVVVFPPKLTAAQISVLAAEYDVERSQGLLQFARAVESIARGERDAP